MVASVEARALARVDQLRSESLEKLPPKKAVERARMLLEPEDARADDWPVDALGCLAPAAEAISSGAQVRAALAAQSVLGAAALLAQRVANVRALDGNPKPCSAYLLTVAQSGDGKDSADRPALRAITDWQKERAAAYEDALKRNVDDPPAPPWILANDITIEGVRRSFRDGQSAQGVFSTEAGQILAGHAMTPENRAKTAATLCGLWDRGHLSVLRGGDGRLERYGIRLSAHLMIQPAALGDVLTDETLSGIGFWPRFLLAWPPAAEPRKFQPWRAEDAPSLRDFWSRCRELLDQDMKSDCESLPIIESDSGAERAFADYFERLEQEARRGSMREIRGFALRATEHACRVAGILGAFDGRSLIDTETARSAIRLVTASLDAWADALHGRADPIPGWSLSLYRWLVAQPSHQIAVRDLTKRAPSAVRPASRRDAALDRLRSIGLVEFDSGVVSALGVSDAAE